MSCTCINPDTFQHYIERYWIRVRRCICECDLLYYQLFNLDPAYNTEIQKSEESSEEETEVFYHHKSPPVSNYKSSIKYMPVHTTTTATYPKRGKNASTEKEVALLIQPTTREDIQTDKKQTKKKEEEEEHFEEEEEEEEHFEEEEEEEEHFEEEEHSEEEEEEHPKKKEQILNYTISPNSDVLTDLTLSISLSDNEKVESMDESSDEDVIVIRMHDVEEEWFS
jgi:hypothetical protein